MEKALALATLLLIVPVHVAAQGRGTIPDAVSAGVTFGVSQSGHSWSGGGPGPQLAGNVEVPLRQGRLRVSLGHLRWTPSDDALSPGGEAAGRVGLSRITATAIVPYLRPSVRYPFGLYAGIGAGVYRYHIPHGSVSRRSTGGFHLLGGVEFLTKAQRRAVRIELEMDAVRGPGHDQVWAYTMFGGSASLGISRRF